MNNRAKSTTTITDKSKTLGGKLLNQLTDLLNMMTFKLSQYGAISNEEKETTSFTNR